MSFICYKHNLLAFHERIKWPAHVIKKSKKAFKPLMKNIRNVDINIQEMLNQNQNLMALVTVVKPSVISSLVVSLLIYKSLNPLWWRNK